MKRFFLLSLLISLPYLGLAQAPENAQTVRLEALKEVINKPAGKIRVINFWATWCAPCIKELPLFEQLTAERDDVEVYLVSMDLDLDHDPAKVYRFIERREIRSAVLLLNESDPNAWIDQVDPSWSGALPATLIVNPATGERIFVERQLYDGELHQLIDQLQ
ncbi:MAG TPA: TlpA disulfide reductase family protein [Cyclobacteriaceae bacterium]|nr:TlpA disulfide reductase family protein [Cyclobacteriaceae bacterium]